MSKYLGYVWLNILKKKTSWITTLVYLIFLFLIFIVVPLVIQTDPISIWKDDSFNVKIFSIILVSLIAGALVIIIFKDPTDDGSELVIATKLIERFKIIIAKFLSYIGFSLLVTIMGMIIFMFVLCWPEKSSTHPLGVDYHEFAIYLGSFFIANLVISIFFGAIAAIFNMLGNKMTIFIGTVSIGIIFQLISMVIQIYRPGVSNYLQKNQNVEMTDLKFATIDDIDGSDTVASVYAVPLLGKSTYDWYDLANKKSGSTIANYLDVGHQFSRLFKILDHTIDQSSEFGFSEYVNYQVIENGAISNYQSPIYGYIPFMIPRIEFESNMQVVSWHVLSTNNLLYTYFDGYGFNSNEVVYVGNKAELLQKTKGFKQADLGIDNISIKNEISQAYEEIMNGVSNDTILPSADSFDRIWFIDKLPQIITNNQAYFDLDTSKSDFNVNLACARVCYEFNKLAAIDVKTSFSNDDGIFDWTKFTDANIINTFNGDNYLLKNPDRLRSIIKSYKLFFGYDSLYYDNGYSWDSNNNTIIPNEKSEWNFSLNDKKILLSDSITNLYAYKVSEFINPIGLVVFWSVFSIALFIICFISYLKIDIK